MAVVKKILVINPNSSESMTDSLTTLIPNPPHGFHIDFFTGPPTAPPSINNSEEAQLSCQECLKKLNSDPERYLNYDGYLVGCYSDHPLVYELRDKLDNKGAQVMGIFHASVLYAMNSASENRKVAILTSGKDWEPILDEAVYKFFNGKSTKKDNYSKALPPFFLPTIAAGIDVLKLADPENYKILKSKINELKDQNAKAILLGCAGLATLDHKFATDFPDLTFVESVKVGIELLVAHVRFKSYSK